MDRDKAPGEDGITARIRIYYYSEIQLKKILEENG